MMNSLVSSLIEHLKKQRNAGAGGHEEIPSHDVVEFEEFEEDYGGHEEFNPHG